MVKGYFFTYNLREGTEENPANDCFGAVYCSTKTAASKMQTRTTGHASLLHNQKLECIFFSRQCLTGKEYWVHSFGKADLSFLCDDTIMPLLS